MSVFRWLADRTKHVRSSFRKRHGKRSRDSFVVADVLCVDIHDDGTAVFVLDGGNSWRIAPTNYLLQTTPVRLEFTQEIRESHEMHAKNLTRSEKCKYESTELRVFLAPALVQWCLAKSALSFLELGPAYTTIVPEKLLPFVSSYTAVDFSEPYLRKQRQFLAEVPGLVEITTLIVADTYELTLPGASFDIIFTSCHPPLVSASVEDMRSVIDMLHSALKPGGVLALFPWYFGGRSVEVSRYLLERFKLRRIAHQHGSRERLLLFLER